MQIGDLARRQIDDRNSNHAAFEDRMLKDAGLICR